MERQNIANEDVGSQGSGGSESLRRTSKDIHAQKTGFKHGFNSLDIRLPKQDHTFSERDIDRFTITSRLCTFKMICGVAWLIICADTIHKITVYSYGSVDGYVSGVGGQVIALAILSALWLCLLRFGHMLKLKHTDYFGMFLYTIVVAAYVGYAARDAERIKSMIRSKNYALLDGARCHYDFHEMMVYAFSSILTALMPVNPVCVIVCQIAATSTLVTQYEWWVLDSGVNTEVQMLLLALLPRALLSFACIVFALHQHRYLSVIKSEKKRVLEESAKAEEERQRVIEERVLRFNAERELDQSKGSWYPTASGANPDQLISNWLVGDPAAHRLDDTGRPALPVEHDAGTSVSSTHLADSASINPAPQTEPISKFQSPLPKAAPSIFAEVDQQPIGRSRLPSPYEIDSARTRTACFLSGDAPILCENPWKPGSLIMRPAANTGRMRVLALDRASGKPTFVKVRRVCALHTETRLKWCELTYCTIGSRMRAKLILANFVLTRSSGSEVSHWQEALKLHLVNDKLCGLQVPRVPNEDALDAAATSESGSGSRRLPSIEEDRESHPSSSASPDSRSALRHSASSSEVLLTVLGKGMAQEPPMAVALEVSHPLFVGCSGLDPVNPWVVVHPSAYLCRSAESSEFKCSI